MRTTYFLLVIRLIADEATLLTSASPSRPPSSLLVHLHLHLPSDCYCVIVILSSSSIASPCSLLLTPSPSSPVAITSYIKPGPHPKPTPMANPNVSSHRGLVHFAQTKLAHHHISKCYWLTDRLGTETIEREAKHVSLCCVFWLLL